MRWHFFSLVALSKIKMMKDLFLTWKACEFIPDIALYLLHWLFNEKINSYGSPIFVEIFFNKLFDIKYSNYRIMFLFQLYISGFSILHYSMDIIKSLFVNANFRIQYTKFWYIYRIQIIFLHYELYFMITIIEKVVWGEIYLNKKNA